MVPSGLVIIWSKQFVYERRYLKPCTLSCVIWLWRDHWTEGIWIRWKFIIYCKILVYLIHVIDFEYSYTPKQWICMRVVPNTNYHNAYSYHAFSWCFHDAVIKRKHFPRYWPFMRGNPPIIGGFPSQRPVTRSCDFSFDLGLNKRLRKQSRRRLLPSRSLWRHRNVI